MLLLYATTSFERENLCSLAKMLQENIMIQVIFQLSHEEKHFRSKICGSMKPVKIASFV